MRLREAELGMALRASDGVVSIRVAAAFEITVFFVLYLLLFLGTLGEQVYCATGSNMPVDLKRIIQNFFCFIFVQTTKQQTKTKKQSNQQVTLNRTRPCLPPHPLSQWL